MKVESTDREIAEAIAQLSGTQLADKVYLIEATVDSVDANKRTCDVTPVSGKITASIPNVRLMATVDDGFLCLPKTDSHVVVLMSTYVKPLVVQFSEIDKIILRGGDLKGLVKIEDNVDRLNKIENLLNDLINKFNTHTHPLVLSMGTGVSNPTTSPETDTATLTTVDDIENKNITQG